MKTATIPSLRVSPELREDAENVLRDGESLSGFLEYSLQVQIERRKSQRDFLARGMAGRDAARQNNDYYSASDVIRELDLLLTDAELGAK
jgi:hypothetical protein